ncbi:MAG: GTP cyclohydrolase II [Bdellovibrionota bacterium]
MSEVKARAKHITLTSHPDTLGQKPIPINWGDGDPLKRGPIIATLTNVEQRNAVGTHSGSYSIYRALAVAAGALNPSHKADLTNTMQAENIGPFNAWSDAQKIVSIDPFGHLIRESYQSYLDQGYNIQPTIAVTKAHINIPELSNEISSGIIKPDGKILSAKGDCVVTKAAIEPVWYLPGIANRFKCDENELRSCLFEQTGGMFPELITRPDLKVFLPPIGGITVYIFGDINTVSDLKKPLAVRVHDECNGSDVFGSDICTCRPYLVHGIELCIEAAQKGGAGIIAYNRKEGRALGEVTKFLVYNARKRQEGGDSAEKYFERTECVAGVQDMRFQELMPDVLHWLGVSTIDRFASMSNMKYDAIVSSGIDIKQRVSIPKHMIPNDANVEMEAKKAAGYYSENETPDENRLKNTKGRRLDE